MANSTIINSVKDVITRAKGAGIAHLMATSVMDNTFISKGKRYTNFGSCSYLGMEMDANLREASKKAIDDYGTQFSSSRAYVSCGIYEELESNLSKIFNAHAIVMPTTTLGHIAAIPVLVGDQDVVIIDHQVHSSVQTAVQLLRARRVKVDMIRHNRMDILEERLIKHSENGERVWYMGDGIYSMFGDKAPMAELYALMDKYPQFYVYLDDAHGMCCYGDKGQGYVLDGRELHPQLVLSTSMAKACATGGGIFVTKNDDFAQDVRYCGGPLITSGPLQPANLGTALAVSEMLLSGKILSLQEELRERIKYTNMLIRKAGLPAVVENDSAVFFIGVGLPRVGYNLVRRVMEEGYFTNIGIFPAVPIKNTGLRFTITRLSTFEDIKGLIATIAHHLPLALAEENYSIAEVRKAFGMASDEEVAYERIMSLMKSSGLSMQTARSIDELDATEWNNLFSGKGMFNSNGLQMLEKSYNLENDLLEHRWDFDYVIIRNAEQKIVLATFLTTGLVKDDMLSPQAVSEHVEETRRTEDPYYLTNRVLSLGSFLSLGEHLYVDRESDYWREALERFLEYVLSLQDERGAQSIMLRDFNEEDEEVKSIILNHGFFNLDFPDDHVLDLTPFDTMQDYVSSLTAKGRRHVRDTVRKNDVFSVNIVREASRQDVDNWVELLSNVKHSNLVLNTFDTIPTFYQTLNLNPDFEAVELRNYDGHLCAVILNFRNEDSYDPMFIGMDYDYIDLGIYRKCLYYSIARAMELGYNRVGLGVTASFEKTRIGAKPKPLYAYAMTKEHYNLEVLASIEQFAHG